MCDRTEIEGTGQEMGGRGTKDRDGDPLFPLMPKVLEALRNKALETIGQEGMDEREEYALIIETICGATDDSQPVEQYNGALGVTRAFTDAHQRAVGQIQWNDNLASVYTNPGDVSGARWCSGTMISADLFLTAGHCFDQTGGGWNRPRVNGTSNIISSAEIAQHMHVNFNYQVDPSGNPRTPTVVPIVALVEYRLGGLDFAIVRLAGSPGATWGQATIATADATAGQMLCIMGHPAGVPKRIEAGPALAPSGNFIRYDSIDTLGGNSGSGVLRASDGRLVGVHTNGGCGPQSPNGTDANFGQRIVALLAASPTLHGLSTKLPASDTGTTTAAAADFHTTLIAQDVLTTAVAQDLVTTGFTADFHGTIAAADTATLKFNDDVHTNAFLDHGGSFKFTDDPVQTWVENTIPGPGPQFDPGFGRGTARPFALATPHHSTAFLGQGIAGAHEAQAQQQAANASAMAQLAQAIAVRQAELDQLVLQYQQLLAAQAMGGGQG